MRKKYVEPIIEINNISNGSVLLFSFEIGFDAFEEVFGGEEEDA